MRSIFPSKINKSKLKLDLIILAGVILVVAAGWLWWSKMVMNPDRALDDALSKNLQTRSITKTVEQTGPTGGISQTSYLSFYPPAIGSQTETVLTQGISSNSASVTTETIGTPDSDFVRYTKIEGAENLPTADRLNELLGTWAKRDQTTANGEQSSFLNEALFGIVSFGYFNDEQRGRLLDMIKEKEVYKYTSVNRVIENNRPVYVYELVVNPVALVELMQEYAVLSGLGNTSGLDPAQYKGLGSIKVKLTVDILSRQVSRIEYPNGRIETYTGQNLYKEITAPEETIPIEELQRRLQAQNNA